MFHHNKSSITFFLVVLVCMKYEFELVICGEIKCIEREREALLQFKKELTDNYGALSSWGGEDHQKECCSWMGVTCSNTTGHVTQLQLHASLSSFAGMYRFGGKISSSLLVLQDLNYLDLGGNDFGGDRIPDFIGSIKTLEYLNLESSNFSGVIPPQLGNLTNLGTLILRYNHLMSENLDWVSGLSLLSQLDLSRTNISDPNWVQHVIINLPSLQNLILNNCMLKGVTVSDSDLIFNSSSPSSLSSLDLSYNELTSSTFDWLFNISTSLVWINLPNNKLGGPIPDAFSNLNLLRSFSLYNNMLEGGIPKSLGNLSHLQNLDLSHNDMGGSLENLSCQWMVSLDTLSLSNNKLTGPVPDLGACSALSSLDLGSNKFTGSLPASLSQLSNLEELDMSHNLLNGTISEAYFKELHKLKILDLSFNSLTLDLRNDWIPPFHLRRIALAGCKMSSSSFPIWLQSQSDISYVDFSLAGISDEMPEWLWNMSGIGYLNLSRNQISGTIPDLSSTPISMLDVGSNNLSGPVPSLHPETRVFQLSSNMFSGSFPSICHYAYCKIAWLDLSNNLLEGSLLSDWRNMAGLVILNVNYNNLSGDIPEALGSLSNLQTLHLRGNNFSGQLPPTLKNCRVLQQIDIGQNTLTGSIPPWLGESLTRIAFLSLRENMFYGNIPPEICRLTQMQLLDLSENNLVGTIPKCFGNFTTLVDKSRTITTRIFILEMATAGYVDYALVQWKGRKAEYNRTLGLLKLIDLSSNKLVGSFPESFSNLKGLISLNLSRNSLTGNIIPGIGEMESLETLDLSRNQLFGKIPTGLAQLNYLGVLDLSNNNLSGKIPKGTQLQSFNASFYAGNNGLCGDPLPLCPNTTITDEGDDMNKKDGGLFLQSSTLEFCITLILGSIVGFWGVVGSLVLKRSWRVAYFKFLDAVGNWLHVTFAVVLIKLTIFFLIVMTYCSL